MSDRPPRTRETCAVCDSSWNAYCPEHRPLATSATARGLAQPLPRPNLYELQKRLDPNPRRNHDQ